MDNYLTQLKEIINVNVPISHMSINVNSPEQKLLQLSKDDIEFLTLYGSGGFNNYMWLLSPLTDTWSEIVADYSEDYRALKAAEQEMISEYSLKLDRNNKFYTDIFTLHYPYDIGTEENNLLPWGQSDNGTVFFWKINENASCSIVVYDEMTDYYEYNMGITEFMYKLFQNQIEESGMPDDLFEDGVFYIK